MIKRAIYLRKKFWESSSNYENRVNYYIDWASNPTKRELCSIETFVNRTVIFYYEKGNEDPKTIIKGFSSK